MYIIASYFGLQLFSLSHKQLMGGSGATLIWSEPLPLPCIGPQPGPVVLYSLPTHRDISSSLVYNSIPRMNSYLCVLADCTALQDLAVGRYTVEAEVLTISKWLILSPL